MEDKVGTWWIKARSIDDVGPVVAAIDKAFMNTSAEVARKLNAPFTRSSLDVGNIKMLINAIVRWSSST